jgi:hypothetical protein
LSIPDAFGWLAHLPFRGKVLAFATLVVVVELLLRRFARKSRAYARWTGFFQAIGSVWTAVLLSVVYTVSVGPISIVQRVLGKDPLDRGLTPEPSYWRPHEANPLGPERASRHQF